MDSQILNFQFRLDLSPQDLALAMQHMRRMPGIEHVVLLNPVSKSERVRRMGSLVLEKTASRAGVLAELKDLQVFATLSEPAPRYLIGTAQPEAYPGEHAWLALLSMLETAGLKTRPRQEGNGRHFVWEDASLWHLIEVRVLEGPLLSISVMGAGQEYGDDVLVEASVHSALTQEGLQHAFLMLAGPLGLIDIPEL